jgi:hypothetical protein
LHPLSGSRCLPHTRTFRRPILLHVRCRLPARRQLPPAERVSECYRGLSWADTATITIDDAMVQRCTARLSELNIPAHHGTPKKQQRPAAVMESPLGNFMAQQFGAKRASSFAVVLHALQKALAYGLPRDVAAFGHCCTGRESLTFWRGLIGIEHRMAGHNAAHSRENYSHQGLHHRPLGGYVSSSYPPSSGSRHHHMAVGPMVSTLSPSLVQCIIAPTRYRPVLRAHITGCRVLCCGCLTSLSSLAVVAVATLATRERQLRGSRLRGTALLGGATTVCERGRVRILLDPLGTSCYMR